MKFDFIIESNNITYNSGDTLLIDFSQKFQYVTSIENISIDFSPVDTTADGHDVYLRWSYDTDPTDKATGSPKVVYSSWVPYSVNAILNENLSDTYSKIISRDNTFLLQFKVVRRGTLSGARSITRVVIDYTKGNAPETSETPIIKESCKATSCPSTNFSSGITIKADPSLLFKPYEIMNPAIKIYQEMSCAVSEMFGHCVRYFKTTAKVNSADTVLKEYSLFSVTDVKDIKILVPDNQFPDNAVQFTPFDMDFGDGLEVHIVREHFERAFGTTRLPEEKDYLYFPIIDRIFEVHSAYLFRDFMASESYYKVMLYKWQDKENVMRENPEIDEYVDELAVSFEDVIGEEMRDDFEKVTKPQQYKTISIGGYDHIRSSINELLFIETKDISNYFTIVAKYNYNLSHKMSLGDVAVQYKLKPNRSIDQNTAFSMWFNTVKTNLTLNTSDTLLDGYDTTTNKGYNLSLNYVNSITDNITLKINSQTITFTNLPELIKNDWYAVVVNHMNEFSQASIHIWKMKYDPNKDGVGQEKTTDLKLVYTQTVDITPEEVKTDKPFCLRSSTLNITNVRIWKESLEEEVQPITLNQYVVRDNNLSLMIDNAIPPLRMIKSYVR